MTGFAYLIFLGKEASAGLSRSEYPPAPRGVATSSVLPLRQLKGWSWFINLDCSTVSPELHTFDPGLTLGLSVSRKKLGDPQ